MEFLLSGLVRSLNSLLVEITSCFSTFHLTSKKVLIVVILHFFSPFLPCHVETEQGIFEQVLHGDLDFSSDPWPSISEGAKDLVRRMLVRDPRKRLTAYEVLCESFWSYYF